MLRVDSDLLDFLLARIDRGVDSEALRSPFRAIVAASACAETERIITDFVFAKVRFEGVEGGSLDGAKEPTEGVPTGKNSSV